MNLKFKGACREVGRSAVLVDDRIMLDYGLKPGENTLYPLNGSRPEAVLVSHAHLDHAGAVPNLMDIAPEVFMTPPTFELASMLAKDTLKIADKKRQDAAFDTTDLSRFMEKTKRLDPGIEFHTHGYKAQFFDAGHIPGATSIYLEGKDSKSLFYTGDINTLDTRLVSGAADFPDADTLIIESTYFGEEHLPRKEIEKAFIDSLRDTLDMGGNVIIPAFAIGRTQEILMLLDAHGIRAYVDGMGVAAYKLMMKYPHYLRNPAHLKRAFGHATMVAGIKRNRVPLESSVIVTTAGMLNGGPVMYYLKKLFKDPKSKILITGYQVEGTNGRMALDNGVIENDGVIQQLGIKVEQYDFSAHCGDRELKAIVSEFCNRGTEHVFTMHGEDTECFAEWIRAETGVDAHAPELGEEFTV
ncbi:MBL fold metallo-hydrolase [Methanolobus halotolerans]|uniref:MBL fold metallo-hydrolase n=1 Tax=Methanolobus halotolerans TaxID=2052935 RepID=UPI00197BB5A7|nr:MBL fold metallo-hydrolase [Methanolobus halotolerans]